MEAPSEFRLNSSVDRHCYSSSVKIRCPRDSGVGICAWLCVYAFGVVRIVVHDVGGCHMCIVIDPGWVDCVWVCVLNFFCDVFSVFSG